MTYQVHKDRPPQETIRTIRALLAEVGLFPLEDKWFSPAEGCHSVAIGDARLPMKTNGKGVTRDYALASAYAEFAERVQNGRLWLGSYGLMSPQEPFYSDEVWIDSSRLRSDLADHPSFAKACGFENERGQMLCVPYYNLRDDRVEHIPVALLNLCCLANGTCAGNTPEEALVQGLGEIAERFSAHEQLIGGQELPTIPRSSVHSPALEKLMADLERLGYRIVLKDATLGGALPVLATIITDRGQTRYAVRHGSSPVFETALERCLTETFQGVDDRLDPFLQTMDFSWDTMPVGDPQRAAAYYLQRRVGRAKFPERLFLSGGLPKHEGAFLERFEGNPHALRFMLDRFRKLDAKVYVRDVSFLGFPSFRVYVPNMTEALLPPPAMQELLTAFEWMPGETPGYARRCLAAPARCASEDLLRLAKQMETLLRFGPFAHEMLLSGVLGPLFDRFLHLGPGSDVATHLASFENLMTFLFLRGGDLAKAARWARMGLTRGTSTPSSDRTCLAAGLGLKTDGVSDTEVSCRLTGFFESEIVDRVMTVLRDPAHAFAHLRLPDCGNCSSCPASTDCAYEDWKRMFGPLRERAQASRIEQEHLRGFFKGL
jgi:ribosomal protein S12 methylthiotransferase accessory factor